MTTKTKKISRDNLDYLVFEGGGGAGNAYPGALMALLDLGLLWTQSGKPGGIKGFAGSSAGAINSLFLSLGYNCFEINYILMNQDFNEFFDDLQVSFVPRVGGCRTKNPTEYSEGESAEIAKVSSIAYALKMWLIKRALNMASLPVDLLVSTAFAVAKRITASNPSESAIVKQLKEGEDNDQIYLSLKYDWGFFSGDAIRNFFAKWIYVAVYRGLGKEIGSSIPINGMNIDARQLTFEQHHAIFENDLIITGSNLETGKTELFSWYSTPKFPIADAARISMSLPLAYKPMVIRSTDKLSKSAGATKNSFLEGVWVDGGLFNNNPVEVFDRIAGSLKKTLSFRLRADQRTNITDWKSFYKAWPCGMAQGTGETQISGTLSPYLERFVTLEVSEQEMGLMDFAVSSETFDEVNKRSYMTVMEYFDATEEFRDGFIGDWQNPSEIGEEVREYVDKDIDFGA